MYLRIAWRNLWRNKRRSLISISSLCFAVLLATFMRAMQLGSYDLMIENVVGQYTGHMQIHTKEYKEFQSLDESFVWNDDLSTRLENDPKIVNFSLRVESFVLISTGEISKGIGIIGIDPEKENSFTKIKDKLIQGEYLSNKGNDLILSEGLAKHLNVQISDSVIMYGQGLYGMTAANIFAVKGIVKYPSPELNDRLAFVSMSTAQDFFSLENRVTSASILIDKIDDLLPMKEKIISYLDEKLIVETWEELLPELIQMIEMDDASGQIILVILYMVIAFGLFGTTMMIAIERKREIATLLSIGMKRSKMILVMLIETFLLSLIGLIVGLAITIPFVYYFNVYPIELSGEMAEVMISYGMEPIMPTSVETMIFINQLFVVGLIALITSVYPIFSIRNLNIIKSMRA